MLAFKAIKPKRLREKEMRLTLLNAMRKAGTQVRKEFERTTKTWEHKPKFVEIISLTGPGPTILVGTDDKVYQWVDKGTKPHEIWAGAYTGKSKAKALRFQGTYTAKTVPSVIDARNGGKSGDVVMRPYVQHPGTEARKFDEQIQKEWEPKFKRLMEDAMREAAKESGHGE